MKNKLADQYPLTRQYPLIEALGLLVKDRVYSNIHIGHMEDHCVSAAELESILNAAPVVYGRAASDFGWFDKASYSDTGLLPDQTHTARLICIEEIKKDSLEQIAKDLVERWKCSSYSQYDGQFVTELAQRAAKILDKK